MPVGARRLLEPDELWPQEAQLCAKAAEGMLLDLRCVAPTTTIRPWVQGAGLGEHSISGAW